MELRDRGETRALRRLARFCGVHTSYFDIEGRMRTADPEVLVAVLRALGQPLDRVADAEEALRARSSALRGRFSEPMAVAWEGRPAVHVVRVPPEHADRPVERRIELEGGGEISETVAGRVAGPTREGDRVRVILALPEGLPRGVHRVRLRCGEERAELGLISAPATCYEPAGTVERSLGVFLPLYALVTGRSWGTADLTDLGDLADWAAGLGCRQVGTLPMLAGYFDEPFDPSPYVPASRLFWNELYADVTAAPELELSPAAGELLASEEVAKEIEALRSRPHVDYRRAWRLKRRVLDELAATAYANHARRTEISAFLAGEPGLDDYARFRAAVELAGADWHSWEGPARDGLLREAQFHEEARRTHVYAQWLLRHQLEGLAGRMRAAGTQLYLDLPIGVHGGGYDVWRYRPHFVHGVAAGAPPDEFFTAGQNWGFPPIDPITSRERGHRYFRSVLQNHLEHADVLRIDHVMGLARLFWIPDGCGPRDGVYVSYPAEELFAIVCLESHRHRARVVGENLGTVPEGVNRAMDRHGLVRMAVTQFEMRADPAGALPPAAPGTLVSMNTHDLPPFASFWRGGDIEIRREMELVDDARKEELAKAREELTAAILRYLADLELTEEDASPDEVLEALLGELARGDAETLIVGLEDLWLESRPQNVPGTVDEYPNWKRKAIRSLESLAADEEINDLLRSLAASRRCAD